MSELERIGKLCADAAAEIDKLSEERHQDDLREIERLSGVAMASSAFGYDVKLRLEETTKTLDRVQKESIRRGDKLVQAAVKAHDLKQELAALKTLDARRVVALDEAWTARRIDGAPDIPDDWEELASRKMVTSAAQKLLEKTDG